MPSPTTDPWTAKTSRRYASTLDTDPGHIANVVVALAATGPTPADSNAGSAMNDPPPATAFRAPPRARRQTGRDTRRGPVY